MREPPAPRPTDVELEILRVIWETGPATVRQVHRAWSQREGRGDTGYSTTLKMMQVMRDKGLLVRDDSVRPQVYRPAEDRERTEARLLDDLIRRAFGGSAARLVMRAVSHRQASQEELAEIQKVIRQAKREAP
jgi:predicted transcriptional regulator